jgi:hypothetical protein
MNEISIIITITPFTVNLPETSNLPSLKHKTEKRTPTIIYWGIYLNNEQISYTSSKELAEETKLWMEKWLLKNKI